MIRPALPAEIETVSAICIEAYQAYEPSIGAEHWQRMRESFADLDRMSGLAEFLFVEEADGPAGCVGYARPGKSDGVIFPREWASIRCLAIRPTHQGRGYGRLLAEECIRRARIDDAEIIGLHTSSLMAVALPMYRRLGFEADADLGLRNGWPYHRYRLRLREHEETQPCTHPCCTASTE